MIATVTAAVAVVAGGLLALGFAVAPAVPARPARDVVLNVLPPGESGSFALGPHSTDQLRLYDRLTPLFGNVGAGDVARDFKPERFGLGGQKPTRVEQKGRSGHEVAPLSSEPGHINNGRRSRSLNRHVPVIAGAGQCDGDEIGARCAQSDGDCQDERGHFDHEAD